MKRIMWNDPATSRLMYRLSALWATAYAVLSIHGSATYTLYLPHKVGHYLPAIIAFGCWLWALHCALLYRTDASIRTRLDLRLLLPLFPMALASSLICYLRYLEQR
ncbi:hypothetical protein [Lysobacter antibioticus]|uniref:Transmembrane protein n=1 Tax=Lysobacter antibioticus TaxID=84531 RepID=A0A0S2FI01_LYSAN|nr:hypothetical protein [Lysobacter antibioticus]ALN83180.1 hypothetical protein LA76x_5078 [Lysobacter antibioticus]